MIRRELDGGKLTLWLDRPEVGNALSPELVEAMEAALAGAAEDPNVRVVVVTGSGRHFSAGADLRAMKSMRWAGHDANVERMLEGLDFERPKLVRAHLERRGRARLETLTDVGFEFPSINYRRANGSRHRYVWGATAAGDGQDVVGIDCESGVVRRFGEPGYVFGEPIFVSAPNAKAEDEGVILTVGSNGQTSMLAVLDARSLDVHGLVHLDFPIPLGFHGSFARA